MVLKSFYRPQTIQILCNKYRFNTTSFINQYYLTHTNTYKQLLVELDYVVIHSLLCDATKIGPRYVGHERKLIVFRQQVFSLFDQYKQHYNIYNVLLCLQAMMLTNYHYYVIGK